jgi:hypothetical protein
LTDFNERRRASACFSDGFAFGVAYRTNAIVLVFLTSILKAHRLWEQVEQISQETLQEWEKKMIKLIIVALFEKRKRLLVLSLDHLTKMYSEPKLRFLFSFSCKLGPYRASVSLCFLKGSPTQQPWLQQHIKRRSASDDTGRDSRPLYPAGELKVGFTAEGNDCLMLVLITKFCAASFVSIEIFFA